MFNNYKDTITIRVKRDYSPKGYFPVVRPNLAVTPAKMLTMAENGIPISSLTQDKFFDGEFKLEWGIPAERQRGVDTGTVLHHPGGHRRGGHCVGAAEAAVLQGGVLRGVPERQGAPDPLGQGGGVHVQHLRRHRHQEHNHGLQPQEGVVPMGGDVVHHQAGLHDRHVHLDLYLHEPLMDGVRLLRGGAGVPVLGDAVHPGAGDALLCVHVSECEDRDPLPRLHAVPGDKGDAEEDGHPHLRGFHLHPGGGERERPAGRGLLHPAVAVLQPVHKRGVLPGLLPLI